MRSDKSEDTIAVAEQHRHLIEVVGRQDVGQAIENVIGERAQTRRIVERFAVAIKHQ